MKTIKLQTKRIVTVLLVLIVLFTTFFGTGVKSYASETVDYPFDETNVLDDLESSEEFNLLEYPWDYTGLVKGPGMINFVEWCCSARSDKQDDYALYVYFYNPQNLDISTGSLSNTIQIASSYDTTIVTKESQPTGYDTYNLVYCNKSERSNMEGLFYKFRVIDHVSEKSNGGDGKSIQQRVNSLERRYDVSGIKLADVNGDVKEYTIGGRFFFTGYAAGYGANEYADSTLKNSGYEPLETLSLEVNSTTYRTASSSKGDGYQNDITSVYFSVPNRYLKNAGGAKVGNLQQIKAEWYEYKTKPMYVVTKTEAYNELKKHIGESFANKTYDANYLKYGMGFGLTDTSTSALQVLRFKNGYNVNLDGWTGNGITAPSMTSVYVNNAIDKINYIFLKDDLTADVVVSAKEIEEYIKNYKSSNTENLPVKNGTISADLVESYVDSGRTKGYNCHIFDANDTFNILSYDDTHSAWDKFWQYGFSKVETNDGRKNIAPIEEVTSTALALSDSNLSDLLFVNDGDVKTFKAFANAATAKDETPYIFHFAQTDYYSQNGAIVYDKGYYKNSAMYATSSVFLDFKIIHLTFEVEGEYKTIPVVQNPLDIYTDITPTPGASSNNDNGCGSALKNLGKRGLAWAITIITVFVEIFFLIIVSKFYSLSGKIGHPVIKIIVIVLLTAGVVALEIYGLRYVIKLISSLGGLM